MPVTHPDPASWKMVTSSTTPQVLRLRLTDLPGWHASIDNRPLALHRFSGIMLQARIPAGRHTVVLTYWPEDFTVGIILAGCAAAGLVIAAGRGTHRSDPARAARPLGWIASIGGLIRDLLIPHASAPCRTGSGGGTGRELDRR